MAVGRDLGRAYLAAVREEPKLRTYLLGAVIDDVGVAISAWGMQILTTNLFTDQRQRATLMMPMMLCFLLGSIVAGPLADWHARTFPRGVARHRWRLVVYARLLETLALGTAIWGVGGKVSIRGVLPFFLISAFMKTALRPTRIAFEVDLLGREEVQTDATGAIVLDEVGQPRLYKVHLLAFQSLTSFMRSGAVLAGLFAGGAILAAASGRYTPLFIADVATNLCFIAVVLFGCNPDRPPRQVELRDLWRSRPGEEPPRLERTKGILATGLSELGQSFREAGRFLAHRDQRPLLFLLFGAWIVEVVNEFYDGAMMLKHVLHGSDDVVRHSLIVWQLVNMATLALLPALARRVGSLGKIFLFAMLLDGCAIALAGRFAAVPGAGLFPFVAILCADHALTNTSGALTDLAQNSASSAGMRGRIAAAYAFVVIVSDAGAEGVATLVSERIGIPHMLSLIGCLQVGLMAVVAVIGGRRLWSFGLRSTPAGAAESAVATSPAAAE